MTSDNSSNNNPTSEPLWIKYGVRAGALLGFTFSIISLCQSCDANRIALSNNDLQEHIAQRHLVPEIEFLFDYPTKESNKSTYVIVNRGDIAAASLSIQFDCSYIFDKSSRSPAFLSMTEKIFKIPALFVDKLEPGKMISDGFVTYKPIENNVLVYFFNIRYYRSTDWEPFNKEFKYYVDDGIVIDEDTLSKRPYYQDIQKQSVNVLRSCNEPQTFAQGSLNSKVVEFKQNREKWKKNQE